MYRFLAHFSLTWLLGKALVRNVSCKQTQADVQQALNSHQLRTAIKPRQAHAGVSNLKDGQIEGWSEAVDDQ
jgi:hypothetical protein